MGDQHESIGEKDGRAKKQRTPLNNEKKEKALRAVPKGLSLDVPQ